MKNNSYNEKDVVQASPLTMGVVSTTSPIFLNLAEKACKVSFDSKLSEFMKESGIKPSLVNDDNERTRSRDRSHTQDLGR